MTVESASDQLAMLSDFGVTATINGVDTQVIFDKKFLLVDELSMNVVSSEPVVYCRSSDVTSVTEGMTCVVNSTNYYVTTVEPDEDGAFTALTLHKQ